MYLECVFDTRKSFYKKAFVETKKNDFEIVKCLYSYNKLVASISQKIDNTEVIFTSFGKFSQTTTRHQKEFFKQNGLDDNNIKFLLNANKQCNLYLPFIK